MIGRLDWFCGTRMHSTIAALSSGTPAAAMAYSPKFQGVFGLCDLGHRVVDLTKSDRVQGSELLLSAFDERAADAMRLQRALPRVERLVKAQLDSIATFASGSV